jgi:hypothetical protein
MFRLTTVTAVAALFCIALAVPPEAAAGNKPCWHYFDAPLCWALGPDSETSDGSTSPFLCRFSAPEGNTPVLLAATRDDCSRAGGTVMTSKAADEAAAN